MKSIFLTILLLSIIFFNLSAQIKVDNLGRVGVGYLTPNETLSIREDGSTLIGLRSNTSNPFIGMLFYNGSARKWNFSFATSNTSDLVFYRYSGSSAVSALYLKESNGYVGIGKYPYSELDVQGSIRYTGTITDVSDKRMKRNINEMQGCLEKITRLEGKTYQQVVMPDSVSELSEMLNGARSARKDEKVDKRASMGFLAQDVQEIFPELVYEDETGLLSMDYISLIPVLVEALKEQQAQIDELARKVKKGKNARFEKASEDESQSLGELEESERLLSQNRPNPFSESTQIDITLAEGDNNAFIYVYDMQGVQKKKYPVSGKGKTSVTIQGGELTAGMYMYALVVGDTVVDTKKMILTQ